MELNGPEKAAVLLLSLPQERAVNIVRHMNEDEIRSLKETAENLGSVTDAMIGEIYAEFDDAFRKGLAPTPGNAWSLQDVVRQARGAEEAVRLFATDVLATRADEATVRVIESLNDADPALLAATLSSEHPQIAAAVLAHIDSDIAADVLKQLDQTLQCDVMRRMSRLTGVPDTAFADIERAIGVAPLKSSQLGVIDGSAAAASIINALPGELFIDLLGRLTDTYPGEAEIIRKAMFTFESLIDADTHGLQQLLREVQSDTLLIALRTASSQLKERLFGCMSKRAAAMLREELEMMPPMRIADIELAQQQIVETAVRLIAEDRMNAGGLGEEMV